jgi:SAM-dependent methyltransferase
LAAQPIPLCEFPFARAFEPGLDHGPAGDRGVGWGVHFSYAFRQTNPHVAALLATGTLTAPNPAPDPAERFAWLGNRGSWGMPGASTAHGLVRAMAALAAPFAGRPVLELGTSRGRLTAALASLGCQVTTLDRHDRGAAGNLDGLGVEVNQADAMVWLRGTARQFPLIVADLHGNSVADWQVLWPLIRRCLAPGGTLLANNAVLWQRPEWAEERGVAWLLEQLPEGWHAEVYDSAWPGIAAIRAPD